MKNNMKKVTGSLIASLALLGSANAMADVTIYGEMKANVEKARGDKAEINSNGSHIGFKGKENISNDVSAVWQYEQGVNLHNQDGDSDYTVRDSYVGLESSSLGKITVGKQAMPYSKTVGQLDQYTDQTISNRTNGLFGKSQVRNTGSVVLETANFGVGGGSLSAATGYAQERSKDTSTPNEHLQTISSAIKYKVAGVEAGLAHERQNNSEVNDDKKDLFAATAGYAFGNGAKVDAGYEFSKYRDNAANKTKQSSATIGGSVPVAGNVDLMGRYTHIFDNKVNNVKQENSNANVYTVGAQYNLSKRTSLGAYGSYIDNKENTSYGYSKNTTALNKNTYDYGITLGHKF